MKQEYLKTRYVSHLICIQIKLFLKYYILLNSDTLIKKGLFSKG